MLSGKAENTNFSLWFDPLHDQCGKYNQLKIMLIMKKKLNSDGLQYYQLNRK